MSAISKQQARVTSLDLVHKLPQRPKEGQGGEGVEGGGEQEDGWGESQTGIEKGSEAGKKQGRAKGDSGKRTGKRSRKGEGTAQ